MGGERQDKLKNWPEKTCVFQRGHCYHQVGGKQQSRTEGRQTEELNEAEGRKQRYDELPCRGELAETTGKAMEAHPEQEAFMLRLREKIARLGKEHQAEGSA